MDIESTLTSEDQAAFDDMRAADESPATEAGEAPETPAAETAETTEAPAAAGEQAGEARQKTVPHAALHEERERRKSVEREAAEERRLRLLMEERTNQILQRFAQTQPQAQPQPANQPQEQELPDPEQNPVEHMLARIQRNERAQQQIVRALIEREQQNQQRMQQEQAIVALRTQAQAAEAEFAATTPDYRQAADFLVEARHKELMAIGVEDMAERVMLIRHEAQDLAQRAAQRNRNPAEIVYEMAKLRGYSVPAPAAPAEPAPPAPAAQVARIAAGQQHARTLGNTRGAAAPAFNANTVANMSGDEFAAWLSKASDEQKMEVMGR